MRYLGLDLGTRTLGISISDTTRTIASTLKTIRYEENDYDRTGSALRSKPCIGRRRLRRV